ncbi:hypothetical protein RBH26_12725 [Natronolimnohabitans sp. A-GB9]|uniref:DUF7115 domain-containing protein n=1 Tax=Natronolimnohabitans sp. A-GB9 TaxID=3069757 RepID=UPI0027B3DB8D|nr:hypothetical protein [Natronolimnohabitans sp. A-GB9]MDQ2051343.1 hypothetical protein [Natronolimnohabitans sp. A-GB9]
MSVPGIVHSTLDGDDIAARVALGGDDELFVTSSSTLVYRSDGLLSDESVDEYPHDAERVTLSEGRRKTTVTLEYPLEGRKEFTIPASKIDAALHPVLAGVLNGNGITDPGETVAQTYRFSELTLIVTSDRLVKHIGAAVWDDDYEEYHFEDVTNIEFEDGSVATQIVLTVDGRPQRIKAPNEAATELRERLKRALFEYHDVTALEELNETESDDTQPGRASVDFGGGVDPLDADPPEPDDRDLDEPTADVSESNDVAGTASSDPLATDVAATGETDTEQTARDTGAQHRQPQHQQQQVDTQSTQQTDPQSTQRTDPQSTQHAADARSSASTANQSQPEASRSEPTTAASAGENRDGTATLESSTDDGDTDDGDTDAAVRTETTDSADTVHPHSDPEPAVDQAALLERIEALEAAVDRQTEVIERQQETIEQLIAELRTER